MRFRDRLLSGPELEDQRLLSHAEGHSYVLPERALIFVEPILYRSVRDALVGRELHPFHVVVSEIWKHLVGEALQTIPSRQRPRKKLKSSQVLDISLRAGFVAMAENAMVHVTARGARLRDVLDTEALRGHFQQYGPAVGAWIPRGATTP